MSRKKKELRISALPLYDHAAPASSFSKTLRTLVNGFFGGQKKTYQPTQQEIADYYLTPREREIAYLAAVGFSIQEIADALGLNFQTARVHLSSVLTKMELDDARALREYFTQRAPEQDKDAS
ncbi:MAG: LuxR family transcriptional regulator [Chloroflexota bacterium]|nr:MAG: LuxR family transcriptional regulator [Chloroflexota bacterium]